MSNWKDDHRISFTPQRVMLASATQTVSTNGAAKTLRRSERGVFFLNVTAIAGISPSLTVSIESSDDGGTTWYSITGHSFTVATTVSKQVLKLADFGDTVRAVTSITGTNPSFTFTVKAVV